MEAAAISTWTRDRGYPHAASLGVLSRLLTSRNAHASFRRAFFAANARASTVGAPLGEATACERGLASPPEMTAGRVGS